MELLTHYIRKHFGAGFEPRTTGWKETRFWRIRIDESTILMILYLPKYLTLLPRAFSMKLYESVNYGLVIAVKFDCNYLYNLGPFCNILKIVNKIV